MLSHSHATDKNNRGGGLGGAWNLEPLSGVGLPFWPPSESCINQPQAKKVSPGGGTLRYSTTTTNNYHTFVYTYILLRRHKDYELYE